MNTYNTYVTNGFSPSMLPLPAYVQFTNIDIKEFCQVVANGGQNAIGHQGTVDLVNSICGSSLKVNRISINALVGDNIYIVMLTTRLEEGKVLTSSEVKRMYEEGKIKFIRAKVYGLEGGEKE